MVKHPVFLHCKKINKLQNINISFLLNSINMKLSGDYLHCVLTVSVSGIQYACDQQIPRPAL